MNTVCDRDWPEDFEHENGNYMNTCCECRNTFTGHKRRVVCKACATIIQGGEAVAWRVTGRDGLTVTAQYPEWAEADCLLTIAPLYTHPADQVAGPSKQIAWKRRDGVMGCKRFMTQKVYDAQSPQMKGNYEPFYCAHCVAGQVADAERWRFYAPEVARRVGVTLEKMNAVIDESRLASLKPKEEPCAE